MASSSNTKFSPLASMDAAGSNTTFVQADPSTFRAVVQHLTGPDDPSAAKNPAAAPPARHSAAKLLSSADIGPRCPAFKLHERRQSAGIRKLDVKFACYGGGPGSPATAYGRNRSCLAYAGESVAVAASPVSPLDLFSPRTPSCEEEERRVIAEKGFYCLQASPLSTPRGSEVPELLPLFPVTSPRDCCSS